MMLLIWRTYEMPYKQTDRQTDRQTNLREDFKIDDHFKEILAHSEVLCGVRAPQSGVPSDV